MFSKLRSLYVPILAQITVPYLLLAIAVAAGATYITSTLIFDSVEERFANQLVATAVLAQDGLVRKEEDLLASLRLLSNIQGVDAALAAGDAASLRGLLLPIALNDRIEYLAALSATGRQVLSVHLGPGGYVSGSLPAGAANQPFVQSVLGGVEDAAGDKYAGLLAYTDGNAFMLSGPVRDANGNVAGALLVGVSADSLAQELRQETLGQVTFYATDGQVLASTFSQPRPLTSPQAAEALASQHTSSLLLPASEGDVSYNEVISAWEARDRQDLGLIGVSLATSFLVQASQFSRTNTLLLTSAAMLLVVVVGLLIAGRITQPISRLKAAAQSVSGGDLQVQVPPGGSDEIGVLAQSFNEMVGSLHRSKQDLLDAYEKTIEGWAKATDLRDHETEGHSRRVTELAVELARSMGLQGEDLVNIRRGALLHDIGKIAVPDSILLKKGPLTPEELTQMRKHPEYARFFIEQVDFLRPALDIPYSHHEKWDGSGYPQGLKGEQIPLAARIFAIVDVWDALTSDRPYRDALGFDETLKHILKESGTHFDPQVVRAFQVLLGR